MPFMLYLLLSAAIASAVFAAPGRRSVRLAGTLFYLVQAAFGAWLFAGGGYGESVGSLFAFDAAGSLFFVLLVTVSLWVFHHSETYLQDCDLRQTRTYFALLMLLTTAIAGAYFASNLAVTWIFLEATTLCSGGIIYHRRTAQTLEAAWKYVFVCSTGIAMAYLGILLLAAATRCESLSYEAVAAVAAHGNPLYLKMAFLLILCGYSCKMELFPLYTVGVDANFAAPAPAAALISTGLVNAGFLAILRVYRLTAGTEVFGWVKSVLLLVGVLSLVIGALFLRRTNNYKRFLSYSTVENMGIAAIGLGIGGAGVWAAVLGMVVVVAFPPSPLFISELMILKETIAAGKWWLVGCMLLLLCIVIYSFCLRMLRLCYQPNQDELHPSKADKALSWSALSLLIAAMILGLWQPELLRNVIDQIAAL